ncbi:hypothetical protein BFJ68_g17592 [Fusarium oxysporum]|uniref:Uncharacterized protein n=1 Tax=Fusarium oxysporum TaxID=5507 RepID=A0A420NNE8_FUSOX|nr:hypothetical protein BFJ68_g17592 [Fusarium oxysporum]
MSLSDPSIDPWVERMVTGYEAHGQREEAWQLTQQTLNAYRQEMYLSGPLIPLSDPLIGPWVERMIMDYEAHGQHEEAWQLTQQTFNAYRERMSLSDPLIGPWAERMILGYETRGQRAQAWRLIELFYDEYVEQQVPFKMLGGMEVLSRLLYALPTSRRPTGDAALLSMIPRQERLDLVASDKLSISCRSLLSRSLDDQGGVP